MKNNFIIVMISVTIIHNPLKTYRNPGLIRTLIKLKITIEHKIYDYILIIIIIITIIIILLLLRIILK